MLIWVVALHCEAKPIIDFYQLKKSPTHRAFDLYQNTDMQCIITGIGKIAAAAATAWVAALHPNHIPIAWINLGIAGAAEQPLGSAFWVTRIRQKHSARHHYPVPTFAIQFAKTSCMCLDAPGFHYDSESIFDMESSAFFSTAIRFSSAERIHCLKIISDNRHHSIGRDKDQISQLIQQHILSINHFAEQLQTLNQTLIALEINRDDWHFVLQQARFSQTQQAQLKAALAFLLKRPFSSHKLREAIAPLSSSREIIRQLKKLCFEHSQNL